MTTRYDAVVVGLGATGSAALHSLASRGLRTLGIDRFSPPHTRGSSHGESRIIREAYFEHPLYVPMVRAAIRGWARLEEETGIRILEPSEAVMLGPPDGELITGALASAREHAIPHLELDRDEVKKRYEGLAPAAGTACVVESGAGILRPEAAIRAFLARAVARSSEVRTEVGVTGWDPRPGGGIRLRLDDGSRVEAARAVLAVGPWAPAVLGVPGLPFQVERQISFWLEPEGASGAFQVGRFPILLHESDAARIHYLVPDVGSGVKAALHHQGEEDDPEHPRSVALPGEEDRLRSALGRSLPGVRFRTLASQTCLYTNLPDHRFLIDRHPETPDVVIASPCSGHGFKFAPVTGELIADLVEDEQPAFDLTPFRLGRFSGNGPEARDPAPADG